MSYSYKSHRPILHPALMDATREVASLAKQEGVRIALTGGFLLAKLGSTRVTGDVDILAEDRLVNLPNGHPLSFGGEATKASNGVPIDVIRRRDGWRSLYQAALRTAVKKTGIPMPIVRPEYLVAMKMIAHRERDMSDLGFLSRIADPVRVRAVIKKYLGDYAILEWENIVEVAKWERTREQKKFSPLRRRWR